MSTEAIPYANVLTGRHEQCYIAEDDYGKQYIDKLSEKVLFLYQNPLGQALIGLDIDQVEAGQTLLKSELITRFKEAMSRSSPNASAITTLVDTLARILANLDDPLSKEAEAVMNLPADLRPGKNQARLRDHCLLTSGIAAALARALSLEAHPPVEIAGGIRGFDERESLAMIRLVAMCHDLGMHLPKSYIERGQALVREIFSDLLEVELVNEIAEAITRHYAGKRDRLSGRAPETLLQEIACYADCAASGEDRPGDLNFNLPGYDDMRDWEYRHFGNEIPLALIAADVDRVQSYVFESAKLAEMRGASLILDLLNVKDSDDKEHWGNVKIDGDPIKGIPQILSEEFNLPHECLIYAAGGGALMVAPRALAKNIIQSIERLYAETMLTATISAVYQPVRLRDLALGIDPIPLNDWFNTTARQANGEAWRLLKHNIVRVREWKRYSKPTDLRLEDYRRTKRFGQLQSTLGYCLRRAKQSKPTVPLFEVSSFSERCAYCHFRPAVGLAPEVDERPICQVCYRKRQERNGRLADSFYINRFKEYLESEARRGQEPRYLRGVRSAGIARWADIESPFDLEAVAAATEGDKTNYIGILYADGNDMGTTLDGLETPAAFKSFADEVRKAIERAVFSGLGTLLDRCHAISREHLGRDEKKHPREHVYHPFEIVSIGGDDVYLLVPADIALDLALHIGREFERAFDRELTLAAGVLIAHVNTPIYFSRSIVKGLLKNAKKLCKAGDKAISAVDFQAITTDTAISEDIARFREQAYINEFKEGLTTRPLTLDQLEQLIALVRELHQTVMFPKSQLYALRDAVVRGPQLRASNFYHYQKSRSDDLKNIYAPLHDYLNRTGSEKLLPFWKPQHGINKADMVTPIVDLVEIYEFVRTAKPAPNAERNS